MAKLPEGREPLTAMESADLVLRMHDKLAAGFAKGDRIAALEDMVEACKADAREAEAYAAELEAKLAKAVKALEFYTYETTHLSAEEDDGSHWCKISKDCLAQARTTLAALKGQDDE